MFDKNLFPFGADKIMDMFKSMDLTKVMADMKLPMVNTEELMATQKKNMDALMEANRAAAAAYQDLFKKQVAVFEETMAEARKHVGSFDMAKMTPDGASQQAEIVKVAFEKALSNMRMLAEAAQKANQQAFDIVSARVKDSMAELQAYAQTMKA